MAPGDPQEQLVERTVTYTLLKDDKFYIIEGVPAGVNVETGEQLFSPGNRCEATADYPGTEETGPSNKNACLQFRVLNQDDRQRCAFPQQVLNRTRQCWCARRRARHRHE